MINITPQIENVQMSTTKNMFIVLHENYIKTNHINIWFDT